MSFCIEIRLTFRKGRDGLPTVMVYETIDLGITHMASLSKVDLAEINHPVLMADPVHDEAVYIYHAFGAHSLDLTDMLMDLAKASTQESATSATSLRNARGTIVRALAEPLTPQSK
jgi:nucleoporin NUP82